MIVKKTLTIPAAMLVAAFFSWQAKADTFDFSFQGPGVSGSVQLTYGAFTDSKYPQALEVTGISGTISDSNKGLNLVNTPIVGLVGVKHNPPDPKNLLAPHDFSRFAVASGLQEPGVSYDNLLWLGGSPQTATDYAPHGGFLDIYGVLFDIGGGRVANIWSDGDSGSGIDYGFGVVTPDSELDYVFNGVTASPEPGTTALLGGCLIAMLIWRRSARRRSL